MALAPGAYLSLKQARPETEEQRLTRFFLEGRVEGGCHHAV